MHLRRLLPGLLGLLAIPHAQAAGLGAYEVQSALGQPLRMIVQITARADETLEAGCFKIAPFTVANDGLPQLTNAQLTLDKRGGAQRLLVSSARPLLDPVVRVAIDVGCDTTLRREFTLLLDPPPVIENQPETAEPPRPVGVPIAPLPRTSGGTTAEDPFRGAAGASAGATPGAGAGTPGTGASAPTASRAAGAPSGAGPAAPPRAARSDAAPARSAPERPAVARSQRPPATNEAKPAPRPPRPAAQPGRDRLSISTAGPPLESYVGAPITPHLTLSTSLTDRSTQQPLPESVLSIIRQKQARLRAAPTEEDIPSLEAELVVLQKRTSEMRSQLDAVMAQMAAMREASGTAGPAGAAPGAAPAPAAKAAPESAIPPTPVRALPEPPLAKSLNWADPRLLLAVLLVVIVVALLVIFIIWLRRERVDTRRAARWNQAPYVPATVAATPPPEANFAPDRDMERMERMERTAGLSERAPMPDSYAFTPFSSGQAAHALGVSDLAQATEKASVFVTLGRPEQAIDVLRDHIDHEPKPSPMAWLMLLDLYRQTSRQSDFIEVSKRFHREFNAETPAWEPASPQHDTGLAAFPHLIRRIRDAWPTAEARTYIEELLYDNRGGQRIGFSLPAFRDLLLLHSIIDDYRAAVETPAATDPVTGAVMTPLPPAPPPHLSKVWATATARAPDRPPLAPLQLDMGLLSDSPDRSALESAHPIIAADILARWGKPGMADYLDNLIRSTNDQRGPGLSNETMAELIMLHDVAQDLGEPERDFSLQ